MASETTSVENVASQHSLDRKMTQTLQPNTQLPPLANPDFPTLVGQFEKKLHTLSEQLIKRT